MPIVYLTYFPAIIFVIGLVGVIQWKFKVLRRVSGSFLVAFGLLILLTLGLLTLPYFLGSHVEWFMYPFCGLIFFITTLYIWKLFKPRTRHIATWAMAAAALVLALIPVGSTLYLNSIPVVEEGVEVNLEEYEPFREGTKAVSLTGASELTFTDDLPRLDGATALYPLYAAFARAAYPKGVYDSWLDPSVEESKNNGNRGIVTCMRTEEAFFNVLNGHVDVAFLMGISEEQKKMAEDRGIRLKLTPIGREAFVFFVNRRNKASDLTGEEVRGIYSGRIRRWDQVGGGYALIRAYQRPEGSGSQTMLQEIMAGTPLMDPRTIDVKDLMMGMVKVVASYRNYKNALGYSFRYYLNDMMDEKELRLLSIDGIQPTDETISDGTYPYATDFYAVTVDKAEGGADDASVPAQEKQRQENTEKLIRWILTPQGQSLVKNTGYVPVGPAADPSA